MKVAEHFPDAHGRKSIALDEAVIDCLEEQIADVELCLKRTVRGRHIAGRDLATANL